MKSSAKKIILAGVLIPVVGTIPLILYIMFGPADGNPIGLGLLAWGSWFIGIIAFLIGFIVWVFSSMKR